MVYNSSKYCYWRNITQELFAHGVVTRIVTL